MELIMNTLYSYLSYISLIFTLIVSLYFTFIRKTKKQALGFRTYPFIGTLPQFIANRNRFLDWSYEVLSSLPTHTSFITIPGFTSIVTAYPPTIEHILKTRFDNYPKGAYFVSLLYDFLGTGIFNADDEIWRHQRKTASFEFNKRSLKNFVLDSVRFEINERLIPILKKASGSNRVLDLQDIFERFAFDSVCRLAFDFAPGCLAGDGSAESEFMRAFEEAASLSVGRFFYALPLSWKLKKFFNIGSEKRLRKSINIVHGLADKIIRRRLDEISKENNDNENSQDLLSRFISASDISTRYEQQNLNFLRDVVISFILAGRDTTSAGLSWIFYLLSKNPDVLKKIRSEVAEVRTRAGKQIEDTYDFDDLREMNYLHAALSETLRLYPPVCVDNKACLEDDVLPDGTTVKKGWFVTYNTYGMGRMESIWGKDCLAFKPERWIDENGFYKPENPFKYPIFHAGPRICLGKEMAYLQMKSVVACVVEQFDVEMVNKEKSPQPLMSLTLRIKNGLPARAKARNY